MYCRSLGTLAALTVIAAAASSPAAALPLGRAGARSATPSMLLQVSEDDSYRYRRPYRRGRVVDAPYTHVDTRGRVLVDAPYAHVGVSGNRVRVIAPFVNLSIPR